MSRLLLLSCSGRKRATSVPLPASMLYTGVFYQVIAKARREQQWPHDIVIGIISAEHGFLEESDLLLPYERKMTPQRAHLLQPAIAQRLDSFLLQMRPALILVAMGAPYRLSLVGSHELARLDGQGRVMWVCGGIGTQLHIVHRWIRTASLSTASRTFDFTD